MNSFMIPRRSSGAALILCLTLIVVVCIALVGFVTTARMERQTANSYLTGQMAGYYARISSDLVRARLLQAVSDGSASKATWASGPGRIAVVNLDSTPAEERVVELHSGAIASADVAPDLSVNLNPPALTQASGVVMHDVAQTLPVRWIYVRRDGAHEVAAAVPAYSATNPVVGRYAFWTDDLTARLNWNTASSRAAAGNQPPGHPGRVDLTVMPPLTDANATELRTTRNTEGLFSTPDEVRRLHAALPDLANVATTRAFDFTHYNHTPSGSNLFGEPRLALTTQANRVDASDPHFFDILTTPNSDPGRVANLNAGKVVTLFNQLYNTLKRTDWPQEEGVSFVDKYGALNTAQMILNLIEYVRSAESDHVIVDPIRASFNPSTETFAMGAVGTADSLTGNSRRPVISEMGVYVPATSITVDAGQPSERQVYRCDVHVEIHWPRNAGTTLDLVNDVTLHLAAIDDPAKPASEGVITTARVQGASVMNPGDYRVVVWPMDADAQVDGEPPAQMFLRGVLSRRRPGTPHSDARVDIVPPQTLKADLIPYTPAKGGAASAITSVATDDPFVNPHRSNWTQAANTFGAANSSSIGSSTATIPPQDVDASGVITGSSVVTAARNSAVRSLAELGRVHTGIHGKTYGAGTPWRTLRLYPDATPDQLPDWALLDLFRIPASGDSNAAISPVRDSSGRVIAKGGVVNLNADLQPFADAGNPERLIPLMAVFKGAPNGSGGTLSVTEAELLAEQIVERELATGGRRYGPGQTYLYPGEVLEVKGVADQGESREILAGEVIDLLTTRSGTYGVYSVGQSIRQSASGSIHVASEQRTLTLLELQGADARVIYQQELGL